MSHKGITAALEQQLKYLDEELKSETVESPESAVLKVDAPLVPEVADNTESFRRMSLLENRFIKEYVKSGKATQSWMKVYKCTMASANSHSSQWLKRHPEIIQTIFEREGLTPQALASTAADLLAAPNRDIRVRALHSISKLMGIGNSPAASINNNIVILEDRPSNVFSIGEDS